MAQSNTKLAKKWCWNYPWQWCQKLDVTPAIILSHISNKIVRKNIVPSRIVQLPRLSKLGFKLSNWNKRVPIETKQK